MQYLSLITNIDFRHPSWDLILFLAFIMIASGYAVMAGRARLIISLFAFYLAFLLSTHIAVARLASGLPSKELFIIQVVFFLVLVIMLFLILSRSLASAYLKFRGDAGRMLEVLGLGLAQGGLALAMIFSFIPPSFQGELAPLTRLVFLSPNALLLWMMLPIGIIFWIGKGGR